VAPPYYIVGVDKWIDVGNGEGASSWSLYYVVSTDKNYNNYVINH